MTVSQMMCCKACQKNELGLWSLFLLGFGVSVRFSAYGSRLKLKVMPQTSMYLMLSLVTVGLHVVLTDRFGMTGLALAFVTPVVMDLILTCFLPLEVMESKSNL